MACKSSMSFIAFFTAAFSTNLACILDRETMSFAPTVTMAVPYRFTILVDSSSNFCLLSTFEDVAMLLNVAWWFISLSRVVHPPNRLSALHGFSSVFYIDTRCSWSSWALRTPRGCRLLSAGQLPRSKILLPRLITFWSNGLPWARFPFSVFQEAQTSRNFNVEEWLLEGQFFSMLIVQQGQF